MINLTDAERQKFAAYLEQDAASGRAMADQVAKLGGGGPMEAMAKKLRAEAAAAQIVAAKLRSIEASTIE